MPHFDKSEYDERVAKTKAAMAAAGIDLLIATNPANMCYLTGFDAWSFYVHQMVLVALDEDEPLWIGRLMDRAAAAVTTYLPESNTIGYPDRYVQSTERHPMDFVADLIEDRGWAGATIGTEMDSYYYTAACQAALLRNLPNAGFADATSLVAWVRVIKSPAEIAQMDKAARIVEIAMRKAYDLIEPGRRQCDAVAEIVASEIRGTPEFGGDYTAIVPMLPTGIGTSTPHITWSDETFRSGEATILELAGCHRRYHCPMARTLHLGKPPQKLADTAAIVVEGTNLALEAIKPGVLAEEVEAVWRGHIAKHGLEKESRIGYSTGLNYPPDWGEHTVSLRPGDKTELQPGMTIHMIPGMWLDDWGCEVSECFQVTETGARSLCDFPQGLEVKT